MLTSKAYMVSDVYDEEAMIFFEKYHIAAKKRGAIEFAEGDITGVTCTRIQWADKYEEGGVPASAAVDHGWRFECWHCGSTIDIDNLEERNLTVEGVVGYVDGRVFCCSSCRDEADARKQREDTFKKEQTILLKNHLRHKFSDIIFSDETNASMPRKPHFYIRFDEDNEPYIVEASIFFEFPGMVIGSAEFRIQSLPKDISGPPSTILFCCAGDREAFQAWSHIEMEEPFKRIRKCA